MIVSIDDSSQPDQRCLQIYGLRTLDLQALTSPEPRPTLKQTLDCLKVYMSDASSFITPL